MESASNHRRWLKPDEAIQYLRDNFGIEYTLNTLYSKSSDGTIPVERPSGKKGAPIRFDPNKLDQWARGEWVPATKEPAA